jgi:hypothetical protein
MRVVKLFTCVCLLTGGLAIAAGNAVAAQSPSVDCNEHGYKLTQHYSSAQLEHALATMPAQIKEYTPCYTVIQDQLYSQTGRKVHVSTGSGAGGGSFLSGPLIAVVIVIVLAGGGLAYYASRRGSGGGGTPPPAAGS